MRTNYVMLYNGGRMPESEVEQEEILKAWDAWYSKIGNALVDAGNPFASRAKSITSDGMVIDAKDDCMPSGYTIIQADSLGYLSRDGMYRAVGDLKAELCDACFTGNYPVPIPRESKSSPIPASGVPALATGESVTTPRWQGRPF